VSAQEFKLKIEARNLEQQKNTEIVLDELRGGFKGIQRVREMSLEDVEKWCQKHKI